MVLLCLVVVSGEVESMELGRIERESQARSLGAKSAFWLSQREPSRKLQRRRLPYLGAGGVATRATEKSNGGFGQILDHAVPS